MPVPAHIRAVKRPSNTVVYVYEKNKDRYGVKNVSDANTKMEKTIL